MEYGARGLGRGVVMDVCGTGRWVLGVDEERAPRKERRTRRRGGVRRRSVLGLGLGIEWREGGVKGSVFGEGGEGRCRTGSAKTS